MLIAAVYLQKRKEAENLPKYGTEKWNDFANQDNHIKYIKNAEIYLIMNDADTDAPEKR